MTGFCLRRRIAYSMPGGETPRSIVAGRGTRAVEGLKRTTQRYASFGLRHILCQIRDTAGAMRAKGYRLYACALHHELRPEGLHRDALNFWRVACTRHSIALRPIGREGG